MCVKTDRKCCYFTSGDSEDHQAGKQDKTWQDKQNMFMLISGCVTGSSHCLCTTSHVSQALEIQSIEYIEDILQT